MDSRPLEQQIADVISLLKTYMMRGVDKARTFSSYPPTVSVQQAPIEERSSAEWTRNEIRQMKVNNEIPADMTITELSRELEKRMLKAAAGGAPVRPMKSRSIENLLRACGYWPVDSL